MRVADYRIGEKYWKKSHNCYFVEIRHPDQRRETRRLDSDADKAETLRAAIISQVTARGTPSSDYLVRDLCQLFLGHAKVNNAPKTYIGYRCYLKSFCATLPANLRVRDLKLHHLQNWLKRKYPVLSCSPNTRHDAIGCVKRVFNWAVNEMEYLDRSPLVRAKKPGKVPRAVCLSKDQWAQVLTHFAPDDPFHEFLRFLLATGCRPQEARILESRHIDWTAQRAHFEDGEVPGKKGDRDIFLSETAVAIAKPWAEKCPEGPIFRNEDGNPWKPNALRCRLARLKNKLPFRVFCYAARHSVATDLLETGASTGAVAAILGHKDPTMVLKVYGKHIDRREQHLRECIDRATKLS